MAQITIHPEITHRLDDHACGVNMGVYFYRDMDSPFYRDLFAESGLEIFRAFTDGRPLTYGFYPSTRAFAEHMQGRLGGRFALMLGTSIIPNPLGGASLNPMPTISGLAGFSLTEQRAFYRQLVQAGVNVKWWQFVNEAHLKSKDHEGNGLGPGTPFFYASGDITRDQPIGIRQMCNDWITYVTADVSAAYHAEIQALGKDTKVVAPAEANMGSDTWGGGYRMVRAYLLGEMLKGGASRGSNIQHIDLASVHSYRDFGHATLQEEVNSTFYDGGETEAQHRAEVPAKGGFKRPIRLLREVLNANGGSHLRIGVDEGGSNRTGTRGPLKNVLEAIAFCQIPAMAYLITHSLSRSPAGYEQLLLATDTSPNPFQNANDLRPSERFIAVRDVWAKYMSQSKDQLRVTVSSSGKTPGGNSIDNLQAVAGRSGNKGMLMVANANLSQSETVTWNLGSEFTLAPGEYRLLEFDLTPVDPCQSVRDELATAIAARDSALVELNLETLSHAQTRTEVMRLNSIIDRATLVLGEQDQ